MSKKLGYAVVVSGIVFLIFDFFGDAWFKLMYNPKCFKYLGCNIGFFGYDAVVHFFFGIFEVLLVVWLCHRFPKLNILHEDKIWKNILVLVSVVALVSVCWELFEYSTDYFKMHVLRENLTNPNILSQPSNSDTMGDFAFCLAGFSVGALLIKYLDPKSLRKVNDGH